jgi:large subunit ribosomal protein L23
MDARQLVIRPVVSEKSYALIAQNKYTFRVHPDAHKTQIRHAVEEIFDVTVTDVRTMQMKPKPKRRGWTPGKTRGWKKAIVELAPGNRIELFEGAAIEQE